MKRRTSRRRLAGAWENSLMMLKEVVVETGLIAWIGRESYGRERRREKGAATVAGGLSEKTESRGLFFREKGGAGHRYKICNRE